MNGMMAVTKKEQIRIIAGLFSPAGVIAAVRRLDIRIIHAILAAVLLIAVTGIGGRMIIANASVKEGQNALERYYTSITIEDCDTLWDIEARYNTGAENKEQYIRSIMQMNHMSSDILYSGQNLIIYITVSTDELKALKRISAQRRRCEEAVFCVMELHQL